MKYLNIDSAVSLAQLENGVEFMTTGFAAVECAVSDHCVHFEIAPDCNWNRTDIKELIQFLKTVRKLLPKESE